MCPDFLYNLRYSVSHVRRTELNVAEKCTYIFTYSIHYSCHIEKNLNFLGTFSKKNSEIQNFMKILPLGAELIHADGLAGGQT